MRHRSVDDEPEDAMRNLVLYELVSVDGVAEQPSDWLFDSGDEVFSDTDPYGNLFLAYRSLHNRT
ncbi:MAG: hypothetical protein ACR2PK_03655 [Acidimicrobiales bacterium]